MSFSPESATNLARAYEYAAYKLLDELVTDTAVNPKTGQVYPSVLGPICGAAVLVALSIEVALKALLQRHCGEFPKTHNHIRLFHALPLKVQLSASSRYRASAEMRNNNSGGSEPLELIEVLNSTKDVFESWRYIYEPTKTPRLLDLSVAASAARVLAEESATA